REERVDGLFKAPVQQLRVSAERDAAARRQLRARRKVVAVDRRQKEQRADAFVEVPALAAKSVQAVAFRQQLRRAKAAARVVQRAVPRGGIGGRDEFEQFSRHGEDFGGSRG